MATEYHFDLYPADDPRDGTRLVRLSAHAPLQAADYRDVIGVGSGRAVLRATRSEAAFVTPEGEQYLRVVRDDGSTELVVGGWWTNQAKYAAAVVNETKRLEVGGAATMAYVARAVMAPHTYIGADGALAAYGDDGMDPFDGIWRLYAQGGSFGGDKLGAILWRVIAEAQSYLASGTYTHRHKDGLDYTDSHLNDRVRTAIPDLVLGFDPTVDSDGNAWTLPSGNFTARIGENVLEVTRRLMQAGLYVEMDPDTFELRAWEGNDHRRDRTGLAWGADVVRLQAPTDGTVATGNIKSDSERLVNSHIRRTTIWTGGTSDEYGIADTPTGIPWEGFAPSDAADVDALDQLAAQQLAARDEAGDVLTARIKLGADPANGKYLPWEHVKLDDVVTVHTGTDEWDYDEAAYPVGALRIHLREGGDWDAWVDLGASYEAMAQRQFEIAAAPAHSHGPNPELCRPLTSASSVASCAIDPSALIAIATPNGDLEDGNGGSWFGTPSVSAGDPEGVGGSFYLFNIGAGSGGYSYEGWGAAQAGITYVAHVYVSGTGGLQLWFGDRDEGGASASGDFVTAASLSSGHHCIEWTPSANRAKMRLQAGRLGSGSLAVDNLALYQGGLIRPNDGHPDLVGTAPRAARCDHRHDVHRDTAPTVDDDWATAGYKLGTIWAQLDDLETPTAIVGVWMLVDTTEGAAVWLELGGGVTDHGALTGLADDDHPQYLLAVDLETAGHWEPVTNGDVSSPEIVFDDGDVVMEWNA